MNEAGKSMGKYRTHLLSVLVVLTAMMQVVILYRQPRAPQQPPITENAPKDFYMSLVDFPIKGSSEAKVAVIEFSDYQCPFCARHATTVLPKLMETFVDRGVVRYALANNPLEMHPNAKWLARVAMCAGDHDKYWEMHDRLFSSKPESKPAVSALALDIQLNEAALDECAEGNVPAHERVLARDLELARRLGFAGTPAFAVGRLEGDHNVHVLKVIRGAVSNDVFQDVITEVLKGLRSGPA